MNAIQVQTELKEIFAFHKGSKTLSDCYALPHSVSIFIPSTLNTNEPAPQEYIDGVVNFVAMELSNKFGGGNAESVRVGFWISEVVGLVKENVIPVNASFDERSDETDQFIVDLANSVKIGMNQESVYFAIDGKAQLV